MTLSAKSKIAQLERKLDRLETGRLDPNHQLAVGKVVDCIIEVSRFLNEAECPESDEPYNRLSIALVEYEMQYPHGIFKPSI